MFWVTLMIGDHYQPVLQFTTQQRAREAAERACGLAAWEAVKDDFGREIAFDPKRLHAVMVEDVGLVRHDTPEELPAVDVWEIVPEG